MESVVSFKIVLGESFNVVMIGIDYGKLGFVQDCFGESFNVMIIGIDYGKLGFVQDCFGERFNVMNIGIDHRKCSSFKIVMEEVLMS
jgi:hypothetical protein